VLNFVQVGSFKLKPVRRIVYGAALCFLAALLAVEAKVAWTANAGNTPSDITAVKLSPVPTTRISSAVHAASAGSTDFIVVAAFIATCRIILSLHQASGRPAFDFKAVRRLAELSFFSPPLFFRPPPVH